MFNLLDLVLISLVNYLLRLFLWMVRVFQFNSPVFFILSYSNTIEKYQKRFMDFMLKLSDPGLKEITLGKGIPKKYLKEREERKRQEEEEKESQLQRSPVVETQEQAAE